jgi:hypothetical protein
VENPTPERNTPWMDAIFKRFNVKMNFKNKFDPEILWTSDLSNKTISRPPQFRETIPFRMNFIKDYLPYKQYCFFEIVTIDGKVLIDKNATPEIKRNHPVNQLQSIISYSICNILILKILTLYQL